MKYRKHRDNSKITLENLDNSVSHLCFLSVNHSSVIITEQYVSINKAFIKLRRHDNLNSLSLNSINSAGEQNETAVFQIDSTISSFLPV